MSHYLLILSGGLLVGESARRRRRRPRGEGGGGDGERQEGRAKRERVAENTKRYDH